MSSKTVATDVSSLLSPTKDAEFQIAISSMFEELTQINARIDQYQQESDRLGRETRAMLAAMNQTTGAKA